MFVKILSFCEIISIFISKWKMMIYGEMHFHKVKVDSFYVFLTLKQNLLIIECAVLTFPNFIFILNYIY